MRIVLLGILLLVLITLNITQGSTSIALPDLWDALSTAQGTTGTIVWQLRIPRMLTALLAGCSLGVAGLLMQTFFRNPIAGPDVLGISSGAHLGAAILLLAAGGNTVAGGGLAMAATAGAGAVLLLLWLIAWRLRSLHGLLVVGLMIGSIAGAVVSLLQYFSSQQDLQRFVFWGMGSLSGTTWSELTIWGTCWLACMSLAWLAVKPLDAWLLGEQTAATMGVSITHIRYLLLLLTAVLTGTTTAFCGPIAFIGVAVPHLARLLFRRHQHRFLLPACAAIGAIVLLLCQWVAVLPAQDQALPINVLTSLIGAPVVILLLLPSRNNTAA